eukprot:2981274-Amphidinium_carterae.1
MERCASRHCRVQEELRYLCQRECTAGGRYGSRGTPELACAGQRDFEKMHKFHTWDYTPTHMCQSIDHSHILLFVFTWVANEKAIWVPCTMAINCTSPIATPSCQPFDQALSVEKRNPQVGTSPPERRASFKNSLLQAAFQFHTPS